MWKVSLLKKLCHHIRNHFIFISHHCHYHFNIIITILFMFFFGKFPQKGKYLIQIHTWFALFFDFCRATQTTRDFVAAISPKFRTCSKLDATQCTTKIAHLRVLVCLCVKTSLRAKLFLWKCVSSARSSNSFCTKTRLETEANQNSEMGYCIELRCPNGT